MRLLPNSMLAAAMLCAVAAAGNAAPPDLRTPAPVIHLADNLDEADDLGWCIDTIGRGFSDRLHAHSCKPRGRETCSFVLTKPLARSFRFAFEEKCMVYLHPDDPSEPLGLVDCEAAADAQKFNYDPQSMTIHPFSR